MIMNSNYVELLSYFNYKDFFLQSIISVIQTLLISLDTVYFSGISVISSQAQ